MTRLLRAVKVEPAPETVRMFSPVEPPPRDASQVVADAPSETRKEERPEPASPIVMEKPEVCVEPAPVTVSVLSPLEVLPTRVASAEREAPAETVSEAESAFEL